MNAPAVLAALGRLSPAHVRALQETTLPLAAWPFARAGDAEYDRLALVRETWVVLARMLAAAGDDAGDDPCGSAPP